MAAKLTGPSIAQGMVKLSRSVSAASLETLRAAGEVGVRQQEAVIKRDSGGDMRLSGVGARKGRSGGAAVGARFKVERRGTNPSGVITATGPLQLINNNTSGHVVRSAYLYGRRGAARKGFVGPTLPGQFSARRGGFVGPVQSNRAVLNIPSVGFRASARHPGTRGKKTWQRGAKAARPRVSETMAKRTRTVVGKAAKL